MTEKEREPCAPEDLADDAAHSSWATPSPEARAAARPAKEALKDALHEITTPEQAAQVADEVIAAAGDTTEKQVREQGGATPQPGRTVQAVAEAAPAGEKA